MRLDKYLKVSRLVKRRTVAHDLCVAGGAILNERVAKASSDVSVGDTLKLLLGKRELTVRIETVPLKAVPAQLASSLYSVLSDVYNNASTVTFEDGPDDESDEA